MATPTGSFDTLDALGAASPTSEPAPAPAAATAPLALPPTGIVWGVNGEPSAACPASYITADDSLVITVWNSNFALTSLTAQVRVLRPDGGIQIQQFPINNIPSNRTAKQVLFGQMEGLIMAATIGPPTVPLVRGQTYVQLTIFRGEVSSPIMQQVLLSDYVTSAFQPGWPQGRVLASVESAGFVYIPIGATPPAGTQATLAVPAGARWLLRSLQIGLHTDAVVANRQMIFSIHAGGTDVYQGVANAVQTATQIIVYDAAPALPLAGAVANTQYIPLPQNLVLPAGATINSGVQNLDVGDALTAWGAVVEEWIEA